MVAGLLCLTQRSSEIRRCVAPSGSTQGEGGNRCVVRWRYEWVEKDGKPGHVRGVDVVRVRDGKVAEKLSYVKG